jgi:hypothetical protein
LSANLNGRPQPARPSVAFPAVLVSIGPHDPASLTSPA